MSRKVSGPDPARSRLRATVAQIEQELDRLTRESLDTDGRSVCRGLIAPWADLVGQLALGPEPEVRECPSCHDVGMRDATVCSTCWSRLEPVA